MSLTPPVPIPTGPPVPDPSQSEPVFDAQFEASLAWQREQLGPGANALAANAYASALDAQSSAGAAAGSVAAAAAHATTSASEADRSRQEKEAAQLAAASAANAPGTSGTSATSLAVAAGTKTLTTQAGKAWAIGQSVVISRTSAPTTVQMWGTIAAYNSTNGAMTVEVPGGGVLGSGTYTDWTIALVGRAGRSDLVASTSAATGILVQPWQRAYGTNAAQITFILPVSPALWDVLSVSPCNGRFDNLVAFNGNKHMGISDATMAIGVRDATVDFQWTGPDHGWKLV